MHSKWFSGIGVFIMAAGIGVLPANAQVDVVYCSNCSTEPTQWTIKLMHDLEYAKQLLQYAIQAEQLADAIKNTAHGGPATLTNVAADLGMLANVVQGGRALAYSLATRTCFSAKLILDINRWGLGACRPRLDRMRANTPCGRKRV